MYGDFISLMFWLLLFSVLVEPRLRMRQLESARLKLIRMLEAKYGSRVITMIHRQERVSFVGIPIYRYIDIEDSEVVLRAVRTTPPDTPIMLILHTPGGLVLAATQIAEALKNHPGKKIVIVPHYAMSGGTLIALAADEIWMDPNAVLGPLDPQITTARGLTIPAPSILKAVKLKGAGNVSDETLMLADIAEKALRQLQEIIVWLVEDKMDREKAARLAKELTGGKWTHDYPITAKEAARIGLPVKTEIPVEVYELMELYPQAMPIRPGIDYLPYPYAPRNVPRPATGQD